MAKTILSPDALSYLRQALHVATLEALLSSRRWRPGEIVFQGGTSLHLAHGSPRFSEDLDFLHSSSDLKRWLPGSWPMDESTARAAISSSVRALEQGVTVMETIDEAPASPEPNATDERSSKGRR